MDTTINIRIPEGVKKELEELARMTGMNLSELLRKTIIPIAKIKGKISVHETIERLEKTVVEAIISLPEFQELLGSLMKFLRTRKISIGFGEKIEEYNVLECDYTVMYDGNKYYPARIEILETCNEYGTCWNEGYTYTEIKTLRELTEFLEEAEEVVDEKLQTKVSEVREYIAKILT